MADARGLTLRLMGGMAIRAHAPRWPARTRRTEVDLDFATTSRDRAAVYKLLEAGGLHARSSSRTRCSGRSRPTSSTSPRKRPVDVLVDNLEMCHRIEFGRAAGHVAADAAAGRAAAVEAAGRQDQPQGRARRADPARRASARARTTALDALHGPGSINVPRIVEITSNDWGWWRTVTGNLDKLDQYLATELQPEDLDLGTGEAVQFDPVGPDRRPARGDRSAPRSRPAGSCGRASANASPGTPSPRRWSTQRL